MGILGGGVAACFLKSSPNFRPKNVIFHTRFQTRPLKSMPVFRPGLLIGTNYVIITWPLEHKQKIIQIHFRMFSLSFLLIWKWNAKYIHTLCSSLENHTWCQAKNGKNPTRWAGTYPYGLYNEVPLTSHHPPPPPPSPLRPVLLIQFLKERSFQKRTLFLHRLKTFSASIEFHINISWNCFLSSVACEAWQGWT